MNPAYTLRPVVKRSFADERFLDRLQLAILLRRDGDYEYARKVAMQLVHERPQNAAVWHTLGQIWTDMGEFDSALECHREALRLLREHGSLETHSAEFQPMALGLAQALMRYKRFEEAWPLWEAGRLNVSWSPWPGAQYYDGQQSVESLLVQSEGGYGDTFMFMRWLPLLKKQKNIKRVGLMIWSPLADFCNWESLGVDEVYKIGIDNVKFDWQYACSIMSMGSIFQMKSYADIPQNPDVLKGRGSRWQEHHRIDRKRRGLTDKNTSIGFCWRAEENTSPVRTKSLPLEVAAAIISHLPSGSVFSLSPQKADLYNTGTFSEPKGMTIEPSQMTDWRATANYICEMDFVLTVDTAVLHLAGLLGVPALGLLPRSSCWRYGLSDPVESRDGLATSPRLTGPWYSPILTYYRQPVALNWNAPAIVKALMERMNGPNQTTETAVI